MLLQSHFAFWYLSFPVIGIFCASPATACKKKKWQLHKVVTATLITKTPDRRQRWEQVYKEAHNKMY